MELFTKGAMCAIPISEREAVCGLVFCILGSCLVVNEGQMELVLAVGCKMLGMLIQVLTTERLMSPYSLNLDLLGKRKPTIKNK